MGQSDEITLREVFDAVQEVKTTLAGMQGHAEELRDHEARLRSLEQRRTVSPGQLWAVMLGALAGMSALVVIGRFVVEVIVP